MRKSSKRMKAAYEQIQRGKLYSLNEAIQLAKSASHEKFKKTKPSVDVAIRLGINASKSDQTVRGAVVLPNGTGKTVRVAVFAEGDAAKAAEKAGADLVGFTELAEAVKKGEINFDIVIATPQAMPLVGQLGQILGPKGLMPNPKVGTVTPDVAGAVKNAKAGQVSFRADKNGIIHCSIGRVNFDEAALAQNIKALVEALKKAKPAAAKGTYLKKMVLSTTMGPGIVVDIATV